MTDKTVSIIIPVYNSSYYLKRCILSALRQTYSTIEILLVDDGSNDKSSKLCDFFASNDDRVRVIHKINQGVSSARNIALDVAIGDYVVFLDSDDWLTKEAIYALIKAMHESSADLINGSIKVMNSTGPACYLSLENHSFETNNKRDLICFTEGRKVLGPVAKLYKTAIIRKNHLYFPDDMKLGEDAVFNFSYLKCCETITTTNAFVYYINRVQNHSATTKSYPEVCEWIMRWSRCWYDLVYDDDFSFDDADVQDIVANEFYRAIRMVAPNANFKLTSEEKEKIRILDSFFMPHINFKILSSDHPLITSGLLVLSNENDCDDIARTNNRKHHGYVRMLIKLYGKILRFYIFRMNLGYKK